MASAKTSLPTTLLRGALLTVVLASLAASLLAPVGAAPAAAVFEGPVPEANCGPGSSLETGLQGQVPLEDRESGRSQKGYRCNLRLLGQYQGQGTTWVSQSYKSCAYHSQTFPSSLGSDAPGVHVVDVSNPRKPALATRLTSPAFLGNTWESLKVNKARGLLAGVQVGAGASVAFFDVYDIGEDCAAPKLLNSVGTDQMSLPSNAIGHEGNWSPDGNTYWATGLAPGSVTAIDVTDPAAPKVLYFGVPSETNHGLTVSEDGTRLYLASLTPSGLIILDVSEVQERTPAPQIHQVGAVYWEDGDLGQHAIEVTWRGKPHIVFVDEGGAGAARIIDISDETQPRVISKLKLEIHMSEHADVRAIDTEGTGAFGYDAHYCDVDRQRNPTALACGYFQSGVRVFDIRNPMKPREIAYYNPSAQVGKAAELPGSEHAQGGIGGGPTGDVSLTADWCSSPPRFVGRNQLWVTCQDNGFMTLKFTNGAYPLRGTRR